MPTTDFNIDYFIAKFTAIPDEKWTVGEFVDGVGRRCALGHCGDVFGDTQTIESCALARIGTRFNKRHGPIVTRINDGKDARYQQPTPKARILAFLRDAKAQLELETNPS